MNRRLSDPIRPEVRAAKLRSQARVSMTLLIVCGLATGGLYYVLGFDDATGRTVVLAAMALTGFVYLDMRSRFRHARDLTGMKNGGNRRPRH